MATKNNQTATTNLTTVEAYIAADKKGRAAIRTATTALMHNRMSVENNDLAGAQACMARLAEFKLAAGTPTRVEFDWVAAVANRVVTLREINDMANLGAGIELPDGVTVDPDAVAAIIAAGNATIDTDMVNRVLSMPLRRSARINDVKGLIEAAFYGQPVNTRISVADVVRHAAANGSTVSNGAVTARATVDGDRMPTRHAGISAVASDADGPIGFRNLVVIDEPTDS